jgi:hypothetical protein
MAESECGAKWSFHAKFCVAVPMGKIAASLEVDASVCCSNPGARQHPPLVWPPDAAEVGLGRVDAQRLAID